MVLHCCSAALLRCCGAELLQCCIAAVAQRCRLQPHRLFLLRVARNKKRLLRAFSLPKKPIFTFHNNGAIVFPRCRQGRRSRNHHRQCYLGGHQILPPRPPQPTLPPLPPPHHHHILVQKTMNRDKSTGPFVSPFIHSSHCHYTYHYLTIALTLTKHSTMRPNQVILRIRLG